MSGWLDPQGPPPHDWPFDPHNGFQFPEHLIFEAPPENQGELTIEVWPPYIGLSTGAGAEGEPIDDLSYERGQIMWHTTDDGQIEGSALIAAPKGVYTQFVFFSGPRAEHPMMGDPRQMEHPLPFDRPGFVRVEPIGNADYLPRIST